MKITILIFVFLLFTACNVSKENTPSDEKVIQELPKNLVNQDSLDIYGLRGQLWHISTILGSTETVEQEFIIFKADTTEMHSMYGNIIHFDKNQSFEDAYGAPCGNDCFPSSIGQYFFSDDQHIYLQVQRFTVTGMCEEIDRQLDRPFVRYYIHKAADYLSLIKSNGDLAQDQKNVSYLASIDSLSNNLAYVNFAEILDYQPKAQDPQKQIAEYLQNKTQIKNFETLYRKQSYKDTWVNLVKDLDSDRTYFILDNASDDFENQMGMISVQQE